MLLSTFVAFTALGFGIWLLGHLLYARDGSGTLIAIAMIGAAIVMATGGAVALNDVEQQTGKQIQSDYTEFNGTNETAIVNNETQVRYERSRVSLTEPFGAALGQLGLGGLQLIVGALLMILELEEVSF